MEAGVILELGKDEAEDIVLKVTDKDDVDDYKRLNVWTRRLSLRRLISWNLLNLLKKRMKQLDNFEAPDQSKIWVGKC